MNSENICGGQRDIRAYAPVKHIVEIAEDMTMVIKHFLPRHVAEYIAKHTMHPLEAVKQYVSLFDIWHKAALAYQSCLYLTKNKGGCV